MIADDLPRATAALLNGAHYSLSTDLSPPCRVLVKRMGDLAERWRQTADAWYERDQASADALARRDKKLNELHAALIAELAPGAMKVPVTMELTLVGRSYARLGDHAVNVATGCVTSLGRHRTDRRAAGRPCRRDRRPG
jgi:phosphate uptake regulator